MERFTPLYAIAYGIMNSMENLRFDKEGYFHILVFYTGYFIKEIENIFPRVPIRYRNTRGSLGELETTWKHSPYGLMFPLQFLTLPANCHALVFLYNEAYYSIKSIGKRGGGVAKWGSGLTKTIKRIRWEVTAFICPWMQVVRCTCNSAQCLLQSGINVW